MNTVSRNDRDNDPEGSEDSIAFIERWGPVRGTRICANLEEPSPDDNGNYMRAITRLMDITERRYAEEGYAPEKYCNDPDLGFNLVHPDHYPVLEAVILKDIKKTLEKEKNWRKGLKIIIESMNTLGLERYSIFFVNPFRKKLEFYFGKGADLPAEGTWIPLRYSEHSGVKCVLEKRTIYLRENPMEGEYAAFESDPCVWVPIIVRDEVVAVLAADAMTDEITDEDITNLEMLARMCAAFIDRTKIVVESAAEGKLKTRPKYWLDPANAYIILEEKPEKALKIFYDLVTHGIPGCVVSRMHPERLTRMYRLKRTPMVWLSHSEIENSLSPDDLFLLEYLIEDFTRKSTESVVLLEGLEYLITQLSFENVLRYVCELKDIIIINNSRLIIPLHKNTLSPREYTLLEKEFTVL